MIQDDRRVTDQILSVADQAAVLDITGCGAIGVQLVDAQQVAAWNGTVSFEGSLDGKTWVAFNMYPSTGAVTAVTSSNAAGVWTGHCGGFRFFRARLSTATAGAVRVNLQSDTAGGKP